MKAAEFHPAGKHVLITGGASGIGLEICRSLAARGVASIAILDISPKALTDVEATLSGAGPVIRTFKADVIKEAEVLQAVQAAHQQAGSLDIVFANAGIGPLGFMKDKDPQFYKTLMDVNYMGVVHTFKAALPIMLKQNSGHLVATNSVSGYAGAPGLSAYSASKYATRGLVESLRLELIGTGVQLHTTAPYFTATPMMAGAQQGLCQELQYIFYLCVSKVLIPSKVAKAIVRSLEKGCFMCTTGDVDSDFLVQGCLTPCMVRPYPLIVDMALSPLYVLRHWWLTRKVENASLRVLAKQPPPSRFQMITAPLSMLCAAVAMACAAIAVFLGLR